MERRNGMVEWNEGMEWNSGVTTPTERGFVTTYTHCVLQLFSNHGQAGGSSKLKKYELKLKREVWGRN
jgi:hypothetical protein